MVYRGLGFIEVRALSATELLAFGRALMNFGRSLRVSDARTQTQPPWEVSDAEYRSGLEKLAISPKP